MKLGVFGGTFDPVHNAHLFVAESARILEKLDGVLFVPTNHVHYRTQAQASAEHRCAMLLGAIAMNRAFKLDDTDLRPDSTGFTADLLPKLHAKHPDATFTFITGADSLASNAWVRFEEVLQQLETFVIAPRAGVSGDALLRVLNAVPPESRSKVKTLNLPEIPESATLIRTLLSQGKSVRYLVPEPVWAYITAHKLYGIEDVA
ncbi:MAG: nicotinate (nicotinamide) nucleotide adenylyltransferase [Candidatus Eremiobacteraeota bacterium]|nr:nicotinate (nicotinamide) nucleotide adenylyltransferase [Candidatus Eremiobacteraeota bacterium]